MKNKNISAPCSALLCVLSCSQVHASGFQLIENNASGQGNAYAGAAAIANDASTVWFNPAGMTRLTKTETLAVGHIIEPSSKFVNNGSTDATVTPLTGGNDDGGSTALVPNFYHVARIDDQMSWGVGVTAPFGLATVYNDNWVGRYHAVESDLRTININPSVAYKVSDTVSVGGGINLMLADVVFTNAIDFGALLGAPGALDGFADLSADNLGSLGDLSIGFNLGALFDLGDTRVGVAYRSEVDIDVEGTAVFSVPSGAAPVLASGAFQNSALSASVTLPQSLSLSVAHDMDDLVLLADVTWTGWSAFEELRIRYANPNQPDSVTTENWDDSLRYSIGADYRRDDKLTLRAGIAYDETPVPSATLRTARVPGNDRRWISFGMTYVLDKDLTLDVGYSHLFISDTPINNTFESSQAALAATLSGTYTATVDILSTQIRWYH